MPSRGSYQVAPGADPQPPAAKSGVRPRPTPVDPEKCHPPTRPDTSFRDCVLSLALVLLIIAILVLAVRPWDSGHRDEGHHGSASAAHGKYNRSKSTTTTKGTTTGTTSTKATTSPEIDDADEDYPGTGFEVLEGESSSTPSPTTSPSTTTSRRPDVPLYEDYEDRDAKSKTSTTLQIERHGTKVVNPDEDYPDEESSSTPSPTTASPPSDEYPDGESESTRSTAPPSVPQFPTVHRAATTTESTDTQAPTEEQQFMSHPLTMPVPDDTDITDPPPSTTTENPEQGTQRNEEDDAVTTYDTNSSTDVDFGIAVGNYQPTTEQGGVETTTEAAAETTTVAPNIEEAVMESMTVAPDFEETVMETTTVTPDFEEAVMETTTVAPDFEMTDVEKMTGTTTPQRTLAKYLVAGTTPPVDQEQETTVEELDRRPRECTTAECKKQSARMLGLMDHSTEPCQDFYQYACGGLRDNALLSEEDADGEAMVRIKDELAKVDNVSASAALRTFRRFYDQCVEDVGDKDRRIDRFSTSGKDAVESIGKLFTKADWTSDEFDLTELLTRLMLRHSTPLIDISLDVSSDAADKFALKLTPPVMPSLLRPGHKRPGCLNVAAEESDLNKVYSQYLECTSDHSRYMQEVDAAVKVFRLFPQVNATHRDTLILEIRQNIEFQVWDTDLLDELPSEGEKRRVLMAKDYKTMTVRQLQHRYSMVDWRKMISRLLGIDGTALPDSAEVQVYFQKYLDKLFTALGICSDTRSLHNTLLAMYARDLYAHVLIGGQRCERKERCMRVAVSLMEDVASALYLSSFESAELDKMEQESRNVFTRLRETLEQQLKDAKWLDDGSRSDVVSKLRQMRLDVSGGRDFFTDSALVDTRLEEIDLSVSNDLMKLSVALTARYRKLMYSLYYKNPNSVEAGWTHFMLPFKTTAVSVYGLNSVMVPFGLLTWPLFDPAVPRHVTLARLGFVIAHEMAHHFDAIGIKYRAGGGNRESVLMGGPASTAFDDYLNVECSVYMRYNYGASHTEPDKSTYQFNLNGNRVSRNERLADDTAGALSLDAAVRWQHETVPDPTLPYLGLTSAQEHFLAAAQMFCTKAGVGAWRVELFEREHPPPPLRVNDMLQNSAAFAAAFHCPVGDTMSPNDRCHVFPALPAVEEEANDDAVLTTPDYTEPQNN